MKFTTFSNSTKQLEIKPKFENRNNIFSNNFCGLVLNVVEMSKMHECVYHSQKQLKSECVQILKEMSENFLSTFLDVFEGFIGKSEPGMLITKTEVIYFGQQTKGVSD